jgi:hypothetical protein
VALIVLLNKQFGLSHGKIAGRAARLVWIVGAAEGRHARTAPRRPPGWPDACRAARAGVRGSQVVSPDETSQLSWLCVFATDPTIVYSIQAGRGFAEAAAVLASASAGVPRHRMTK